MLDDMKQVNRRSQSIITKQYKKRSKYNKIQYPVGMLVAAAIITLALILIKHHQRPQYIQTAGNTAVSSQPGSTISVGSPSTSNQPFTSMSSSDKKTLGDIMTSLSLYSSSIELEFNTQTLQEVDSTTSLDISKLKTINLNNYSSAVDEDLKKINSYINSAYTDYHLGYEQLLAGQYSSTPGLASDNAQNARKAGDNFSTKAQQILDTIGVPQQTMSQYSSGQ